MNLPRILGRIDDPISPGFPEVRMIEQIQEVAPELHSDGFGDGKILLQSQVNISVARTRDRTLSRAIPEREDRRRRLKARVVPLQSCFGHSLWITHGAAAVWTRAGRARSRIVRSIQ